MVGLFFAGVFAMLAAGAPVAAAAAPTFEPVACRDPAWTGARCGLVRVPENRGKRGGRVISLYVAILPALDGPATKTPLYDIVGGPGDGATIRIPSHLTARASWRRGRDIVLIDQRGTGASNSLVCPHFIDKTVEAALEPLYALEDAKACLAYLSQRADLRRYTTLESVRDTEAVRAALGHPRIDLFAASYGTTLALQYLKAHPQRVRAAVLVGAVPASAKPPTQHAIAGRQALDALFVDCAAEPACSKAFPAPEADLKAAMARLAAGEPAGGPRMLPEVFMEKLRSVMYRPVAARRVPYILRRAAEGDFAPFLALYAAVAEPDPNPFADGLYIQITCTESFGHFDYEAAARASRETPFGDYRLRRQRDVCALWPKGELAGDHFKPVRADTPVLFLSGRIDSVARQQWATEAAAHLPNSRQVVIGPGTHALTGTPGLAECLHPLIVQVFDTASIKDLDVACVAEMKGPPFVLGPG